MGQQNNNGAWLLGIQAKVIAAFVALAAAAPAGADPSAGAYLAARQAETDHEFATASMYFTAGLLADPRNAAMLDSAQRMYAGAGDLAQAVAMARELVAAGQGNSVAHLLMNVADVQAGDWDAVLAGFEDGRQIGPLVDGIAVGWAHVGKGDIPAAMEAFDRVIAHEAMAIYGVTHKAYALATVGDFEGAQMLFSNNGNGGMRYSRQSAIAHVQIMSQLGDNAGALEIVDAVFGAQLDPELQLLRAALARDEAVAYTAVRTPEQGMAELYHVIARILNVDAPADFTLIYARAANALWPENTTSVLMTADLLEDLAQYDLASATYGLVPADDPSYYAAELGRAEVLRAAGRDDEALAVLNALALRYPDIPEVHATLGDTLRELGDYDAADRAYSEALALYSVQDPAKWFVHYTRAISRHKIDNWTGAEADFRAALALNPDQPQVLNYLGYSLVERGEKMDEALTMIETAVAASPDTAAIVDSLGWVLFKRGDYDGAVVHLERAAELSPTDPVINDHLGDALWAVGREVEAAFHWQRALSFDPVDQDAVRIRAKLDRGLDAVLADERAAAVAVPVGVTGDDS